MKSPIFGRLLKAGIGCIANCEGKKAIVIEEELGQEIAGGRAGSTIQRYKNGYIPPDFGTVEILAENIIKRGLLSRQWAEKFLAAARYPFPTQLLDKLCPVNREEEKREARIYSNLPASTYGKFVMRKEAYEELSEALSQRWAVIQLVSMKGMGKTSLARELAHRCLQHDSDMPQYDAAVWIGNNERGSETYFNTVLDDISHTLGYPGLTGLSQEKKFREVEQLLRRQKVLLIMDGAETIKDNELFEWILNLPEPSKCLVTTSDKVKILKRNTFSYELKGMIDEEAQEFISLKLRQLNLSHLVSVRSDLEPLLSLTGGNPKAIEIILGYMKYRRQSLSKTLEALTSAGGELFETLFSNCWGLIEQDARKVLLAMQMFPYSASPDALAAVAEVKQAAFDQAIDRLTDLSLIDVLQEDLESPPRYKLYSLVSSFVVAKNKENKSLEESFRARWISWYSDLASKIGFCWNDINRLKLLDPPGERQTIQLVINWTFQNGWYDKTIQISKDVRYYFYVRGFWTIDSSIHLLRAKAAKEQSNFLEEFDALLYHANIASKQGNVDEVERHIPRLDEILKTGKVPENLICDYKHVKALYLMAGDSLKDAEKLWQENLKKDLSPHAENANRRWYAVCLYRDGKIKKAREILEELLKDAKKGERKFIRGEIAANVRLAWIDIDQKDYETAQRRLTESLEQATNTAVDQRAIADVYHCQGVIHLAHGEQAEALRMLTEAANLFERLGMPRELHEVRKQLNTLKDSFKESS